MKIGDTLYSKYDPEKTTTIIFITKDGWGITNNVSEQYPYGVALKIKEINKEAWCSDKAIACNLLIQEHRDYIVEAEKEIERLEKFKAE